jgi:hypothetical protein
MRIAKHGMRNDRMRAALEESRVGVQLYAYYCSDIELRRRGVTGARKISAKLPLLTLRPNNR